MQVEACVFSRLRTHALRCVSIGNQRQCTVQKARAYARRHTGTHTRARTYILAQKTHARTRTRTQLRCVSIGNQRQCTVHESRTQAHRKTYSCKNIHTHTKNERTNAHTHARTQTYAYFSHKYTLTHARTHTLQHTERSREPCSVHQPVGLPCVSRQLPTVSLILYFHEAVLPQHSSR